MTFHEVIELHPQPTGLDRNAMLRCIDECLDCAASCTSCADADLAEDDVREMVRCIRLCLACAEECDRHAAHHEHCRLCAEVCRRCKNACDELLATVG